MEVEHEIMSDSSDEIRDSLPDDLNLSAFVGTYQFPDNSRRKVPGTIYLVAGSIFIALTLIIGVSINRCCGCDLVGCA